MSLKRLIVSALVQLPTIPPHSWTRNYPFVNWLGGKKRIALCEKLSRRSNGIIFGGPLSGTKLLPGSDLARYPQVIVGCYELEIHAALHKVLHKGPKKMIDIGAANGLYTVGLGRQLPNTQVVAFEADKEGHWEEAKRFAELNGAKNISQEGFCQVEDLRRVCDPESFVLCDCEGGEKDLMDPEAVPALKSCFIVVELHEFNVPGITRILIERFQASHHIHIQEELGRDPQDYRILQGLPEALRKVAVCETRFVEDRLVYIRHMVLTPKDSQFWAD